MKYELLPPIERLDKELPNVLKKGDIEIAKLGIAYMGSLRSHPYKKDRILLIEDPFNLNSRVLEFKKKDILAVEKVESLASPSGKIVNVARIWVKKGAMGIKYEPFVVEDTHNELLSIFQK
jgi:hypothetical protein